MEMSDANHTKQYEIRTCHGMEVVSTNEQYSEEEYIHMRSNGPMEYNCTPGNNAAPPAVTDKMKTIEAFQHIYPKGSKFQHNLSIEGYAGISPGWCEGIVVAHYDCCVLVRFRVDNASRDKLCDDLDEWPLSAFWDGALYEKQGRIYNIRQYPIADVLLAFDLCNAVDESSSSIWRAGSGGRRSQPDARLYLGHRVAKLFSGKLFLGTVVGYTKHGLWKIYYDDGDDEEYDRAELIRFLKLYKTSVESKSETAACARLRNAGNEHVPVQEEGSLPNPDRETLKKVLNSFIDAELSMRIAKALITEKPTLAAEPVTRDFNAGGVIDDEGAGRSQTPVLDVEDFDESGVIDDAVGSTTHQEGSLDIDCTTVEIHHLNEEESVNCARKGRRLGKTVASCNDTASPLLLGHPLPSESEHSLSKSQSQWADFPIGSPVMFKEKLEATVECAYFNFRDKLYRYGIQLCRGGSRLQVRGTDLSLIVDCPVSVGHTGQLVGRSTDIDDNRFMMQGSSDEATLGAGGVSDALNIPLACLHADNEVVTADERASTIVGIGMSRSGLPTMVSPLDVAHRKKPIAISDASSMILSIPNFNSKKHTVDPEYEPYVRKEARGYAVETPALRRGIGGKNRRRIKLNNRPWLKRGVYGRSSRIT